MNYNLSKFQQQNCLWAEEVYNEIEFSWWTFELQFLIKLKKKKLLRTIYSSNRDLCRKNPE